MTEPLRDQVQTYLETSSGYSSSWTIEDTESALNAEKVAQAHACRVPATEAEYPADLVEALCRRVARNLAVRSLPLGFQASMSEGGVAVTRLGADPEVRRLEAPYRKLVIG